MKRFIGTCLAALVLFGCATAKPAEQAGTPDPRQEALKQGVADLRKGLDALDDEDDEAAAQAFVRALRQFDAADREALSALQEAAGQLAKIVEISGFEYARKESFSLLLMYLDMQRAYADRDTAQVRTLGERFGIAYREAVQRTAEEKQKRLEEIGAEIALKRDEIQKGSEPSVLDVYPAVYLVKKGDTLPGIAGRNEIYNDSFMWPLIYKANRDQIKDPKVLYAGQELKIPRDLSVEEIVDARREAGAHEPDKIPRESYTPKGKKK